jgi:hypothetical protein
MLFIADTDAEGRDWPYGVCHYCGHFVVSDAPTKKAAALEIETEPCPECGIRSDGTFAEV